MTSGTGAGAAGGAGGEGPVEACAPGEERACYGGPPGTQEVGICQGGTQVCQDDGRFGPCAGEVLPAQETCAPADEDCDGQVNEQGACYGGPEGTEGVGACRAGVLYCDVAPDGVCLGEVRPHVEECATAVDDDCDGVANDHCALWNRRFGGGEHEHSWGVAVDSDGSVVVVGDIISPTDFGGGPLTSSGLRDVFVAKFDASGNYQWARRFGNDQDQSASAVALSPSGEVYVTGWFEGTMNLGSSTLISNGGTDAFILKLDPSGNVEWGTRHGNAADQAGIAIAATDDGAAMVGRFAGTVTLAGQVRTSNGQEDAFLLRVDEHGAPQWGHAVGGSARDEATGVAFAANGDVVLAGSFGDTIDFAGTVLETEGESDVFVTRYDAMGNHVWSTPIGGNGQQEALGLALDAAGAVLVTGRFTSEIALAGQTRMGAGAWDAFVAKLGSGGQPLWGQAFVGPDDQVGNAVTTDQARNVVLAVGQRGTVDYGSGPVLSAGMEDMVLVQLTPDGEHRYTRRFGDELDQDPRSVAIDGSGNVLMTGDCMGVVDFGRGPLQSNATGQQEDICLVKIAQ
ncbi:hypothetical protein [Chondromyces crocatus]|uniref:hypothetical protein n=1 Tax=Chondromyces crocatus TaxID=52 RepID=UPI0012E15933|nr:hypothetical protein [Chondromyces crocatus]